MPTIASVARRGSSASASNCRTCSRSRPPPASLDTSAPVQECRAQPCTAAGVIERISMQKALDSIMSYCRTNGLTMAQVSIYRSYQSYLDSMKLL